MLWHHKQGLPAAVKMLELMRTQVSLRELLTCRAYLLFWSARLTTQLASQMMMVALGWQMYDLSASAWDLGLVGLAQFVPALLLTLPAGHVADRVHRARLLQA